MRSEDVSEHFLYTFVHSARRGSPPRARSRATRLSHLDRSAQRVRLCYRVQSARKEGYLAESVFTHVMKKVCGQPSSH